MTSARPRLRAVMAFAGPVAVQQSPRPAVSLGARPTPAFDFFTPPPPPPCALSLAGLLVIAAVYFALGVGVGVLVQRLQRFRTATILLIVVPGAAAGLAYLAWLLWTLR